MHRERLRWLRGRGRMVRVALAGAVLMLASVAAGAYAGLRVSGRPLLAYRGEGAIRVVIPAPPAATAGTNARMPLAAYFQNQVFLLQSMRTSDAAVRDSAWAAAGVQPPAGLNQALRTNVVVAASPADGVIRVSFTHDDPAVAATAVTGVLNAYVEMFTEDGRQRDGYFAAVADQEAAARDQLKEIEAQLREATAGSDLDGLGRAYDEAARRIQRAEAAMWQTRSRLERLSPVRLPAGRGEAAAPPDGREAHGDEGEVAAARNQLKQLEAAHTKARDATRLELFALDEKRVEINRLTNDRDTTAQRLRSLSSQSAALRASAATAIRVSVQSPGRVTAPGMLNPAARRHVLVGAATGAQLGVVLLAAARIRRRFRPAPAAPPGI